MKGVNLIEFKNLFKALFVFIIVMFLYNGLYSIGYYKQTIRFLNRGSNQGEVGAHNFLYYNNLYLISDRFVIKNNHIFILDIGNHRIQKFNMNGDYISEFGNINMEGFRYIGCFNVDENENYYIFGVRERKIIKYNRFGNKIFEITTRSDGIKQFRDVQVIEIDNQGNIYIGDSSGYYLNRIDKYDLNGNYMLSFGNGCNGKFILDKYSQIWYLNGNKIRRYNQNGSLISTYVFNNDGEYFTSLDGIDSDNNIYIKIFYEETENNGSIIHRSVLYRYKIQGNYVERKEILAMPESIVGLLSYRNLFEMNINENDNTIFGLRQNDNLINGRYIRVGLELFILIKIENATPSWSPDSTKILFETNVGGRWNVNTQMLGGIFNISTDSDVSARNASWSADMTKVVYVSQKDGNWNVYYRTIGTSAVGTPVQVTSTTADETSPYFSPDMTKVLYGSNEGGKWHIYEKNLSSGAVKQLTSGNYDEIHGRYAPDGNKIAYTSKKGGSNWDIYVKDMETNVETKITQGSADKLYPCWSPDCKKIAYSSNEVYTGTPGNPDGEWKLYVLDNLTGTGVPARIVSAPGNHRMPDWSKNGMKIAFVSDGEYFEDIYVINADGTGQVWRVTQ